MKSYNKTITRTLRNRSDKLRLKTLFKKILVNKKDFNKVRPAAISYISALDKAVKHGVIHVNRANERKSFLSRYIFTYPDKKG